MNKLIKKANGRYIIQNNIEYILRFRKYNIAHVNIVYNKILNVIRIVFILFFFYAKIYKINVKKKYYSFINYFTNYLYIDNILININNDLFKYF